MLRYRNINSRDRRPWMQQKQNWEKITKPALINNNG